MAPAEIAVAPRSRAARDGAVSLVASGIVQLLTVVSAVLVARALGPAGRGELAAIMLWPALLAAAGALGCGDAVAHLVARRPDRAREIGGTALGLAAVQGAVVVAAGALVVPAVLGRSGEGAVLAGRVYLLWAPAMLLTAAGTAVLRSRMSALAAGAIRVGSVALTVAALLAVAAAGRLTLTAIVAVYLAASVLALAVTLAALAARRELGLTVHRDLVGPVLAGGLRAHVGTVGTLVAAQAAPALVSLLLAPAALGQYSVAVTVTSAVGLVGTTVALVAMPAVGRCRSAEEMRRCFAGFVRATLALSALAALATALLTPSLLARVFGAGFAPAAGPAWVLLAGAAFASTNVVLAAGLNAFDRPLASTTAQLVAAGVAVLALAVLLPRFGLLGAALASALACAAATLHMVARAGRLLAWATRPAAP